MSDSLAQFGAQSPSEKTTVLEKLVTEVGYVIWLRERLILRRVKAELSLRVVVTHALSKCVPRTLGLLHVERAARAGSKTISDSDQVEFDGRLLLVCHLINFIQEEQDVSFLAEEPRHLSVELAEGAGRKELERIAFCGQSGVVREDLQVGCGIFLALGVAWSLSVSF